MTVELTPHQLTVRDHIPGWTRESSFALSQIQSLEIESTASWRMSRPFTARSMGEAWLAIDGQISLWGYPRAWIQFLSHHIAAQTRHAQRNAGVPRPPLAVTDMSAVPEYMRDLHQQPANSKLTIEQTPGATVIVAGPTPPWGNPFILAAWCAFLFGAFLAMSIFVLIVTRDPKMPGDTKLLFAIFPVCILAAAIWGALDGLARHRRRTVLKIQPGQLICSRRGLRTENHWAWGQSEIAGIRTEISWDSKTQFAAAGINTNRDTKLILQTRSGHTFLLARGNEADMRWTATLLRSQLSVPLGTLSKSPRT
jgi:hypothetical protein